VLARHAWAARVYALLAIMSGWVWFRARDIEHALSFFGGLAGANGVTNVSVATRLAANPATIAALLIGAILAMVALDLRRLLHAVFGRLADLSFALTDAAAIVVLFALAILSVAAGSYSPFLYFRF